MAAEWIAEIGSTTRNWDNNNNIIAMLHVYKLRLNWIYTLYHALTSARPQVVTDVQLPTQAERVAFLLMFCEEGFRFGLLINSVFGFKRAARTGQGSAGCDSSGDFQIIIKVCTLLPLCCSVVYQFGQQQQPGRWEEMTGICIHHQDHTRSNSSRRGIPTVAGDNCSVALLWVGMGSDST